MTERKPPELHLLHGTVQPSRRPGKNAPKPAAGMPTKPRFVQGAAARLWKRLAPKLVEAGILTPLDGNTLALWCTLAAEFEADPAGRCRKALDIDRVLQIEIFVRCRLSRKRSGQGGLTHLARSKECRNRVHA